MCVGNKQCFMGSIHFHIAFQQIRNGGCPSHSKPISSGHTWCFRHSKEESHLSKKESLYRSILQVRDSIHQEVCIVDNESRQDFHQGMFQQFYEQE